MKVFVQAVNRMFGIIGFLAIVACAIIVYKHCINIVYPQLKYNVPQPVEWGHEFYVKGAEYDKLSKSLVKVLTPHSSGSGVIIRKDGDYIYILTNHHVTFLDSKQVTVALLYDDRSIHLKNGKTIARDRKSDIVIIRIKHLNYSCRAMRLAVEAPRVGDKVYNLSNPLGFEKVYTEGRVFHTKDNVFMTSVTVGSGSSGSPVMNAKGELIGLVQAMLQARMKDVRGRDINFTFPSAVKCVPLEAITQLCDLTFESKKFKREEKLLREIREKVLGDWKRHEFQKNFNLQ